MRIVNYVLVSVFSCAIIVTVRVNAIQANMYVSS